MKCILAGIVVLSMVSMIYCVDDPCSAPTDAELKCLNEKHGVDVAQSCKTVDFTALQQGDVQRSKVCSVPDCITALDKDVYSPCSRSDLTACLKSVCANCTNVNDDEMKCMVSAANRSADELTKRCAGVDMKRLTKDVKDLEASQLCHHPSCISALRENVYEPCKRGDLAPCILHFCNTGGTCPAVTADQLHCLDNSESTNGDLIKTYCDGVDLDLLKAQKVLESKICDHPECLATLDKAMFIPCQRSDLGGCVLQVCGGKCSVATTVEMRCMVDASTKNEADVQANCQGVDFIDLQNRNFKRSGICDNPECLQTLDKFLYVPCNRSDITLCVREGCDCSPLSSDELKCMNNAFVKNETEIKTPCNGVDFVLLQRGDIANSKICDHPECSKALTTYVYIPCKRPDAAACVVAGCPS